MIYNESVIESVKKILTERKKTISVAESVTAGHLQAAFSSAKEASKFFQGGITVYNLGQKTRHLHIDPIVALQNDCVTEEIACKMASEVSNLFVSDFGIAITGYAVRVPEKDIHDLFAFFAIANNRDIALSGKITTDKKEGVDTQVDYANQVIAALEKFLAEEA